MAKETEKKAARILFVEQNKGSEEIAVQLSVNKRTVDRWVKEGEWKKIRDAKTNAGKERIERLQQVADSLTEERIQIIERIKALEQEKDSVDDSSEVAKELYDLRRQSATIDDAIAKWNKRIESVNKETRITLTVCMEVMESVFDALRSFDQGLYMQTLDFQEAHLHEIATKL